MTDATATSAFLPLLEPKLFEVESQSGKAKKYFLSKFPAVAGREIVAKYPLTGLPKLGNYEDNQENMFKLMSFVGVEAGDKVLRLSTRALVDNHIPDWETLAKVEMAMIEYNCSFFLNGKASTFLSALSQRLPALVSKILTDSWAQSSPAAKPPLTN